jgi:hypothetical protein
MPSFTEVPRSVILGSYHARIRERLTRRRHMPLVRVEETDSGGFTVLNLQMVARVKCAGFDGSQQEHRASVFFSDGGTVELAGPDADRVLNAMEDFAGYHRS